MICHLTRTGRGKGGIGAVPRHANAFTLIEMLVVVAIIGILAALLLPSLARAKDSGRKIYCIGNLHQLQICWHMYSDDNHGGLAPNDDIETVGGPGPGGGASFNNYSWCEGNPRYDLTPSNIEAGLLFPYNSSTLIYHCPSDNSTVLDANNNPLPQLRTRSYNMSQSVNGLGMMTDPNNGGFPVDVFQPCFETMSSITNPAPSKLFVFLDENAGTIQDAQFGYPMPSYQSGVWWDMPSDRHEQGANFSFADGHVEYWRWASPMTVSDPIAQPVAPAQLNDYNRIGSVMRIVVFNGQAQ